MVTKILIIDDLNTVFTFASRKFMFSIDKVLNIRVRAAKTSGSDKTINMSSHFFFPQKKAVRKTSTKDLQVNVCARITFLIEAQVLGLQHYYKESPTNKYFCEIFRKGFL